jgi:hypothetical protein
MPPPQPTKTGETDIFLNWTALTFARWAYIKKSDNAPYGKSRRRRFYGKPGKSRTESAGFRLLFDARRVAAMVELFERKQSKVPPEILEKSLLLGLQDSP